MKVLSLTNEFEEESFGGAGTAVTGMVHMLDRMGFQQTVIVPSSYRNIPDWTFLGQQIKVLWLPRNNYYFGHLGLIKADVVCQKFPEICQRWDVIHCHAINYTPLAYALSQGVIPILYSVYSFLRKELGDLQDIELQAQFKIQDELLMRSHGIHLISQSEKQYLTGRFPQYLSKSKVLPIGINISGERWQQGARNEVLYVGRLLDYKGVEDLIKSVSISHRRGFRIHLHIVGKGTEYYEGYLKRLVQALSLGSNIHFHGRLSNMEVRQRMARTSALVVPSRREAFGLVALEGMAIGTPVISSNAGGLSEVAPNSCAYTYEAGNITKLSEALVHLLNNPFLQKILSNKGHQNALRYDWSQLAPDYYNLLESVSGGRSF